MSRQSASSAVVAAAVRARREAATSGSLQPSQAQAADSSDREDDSEEDAELQFNEPQAMQQQQQQEFPSQTLRASSLLPVPELSDAERAAAEAAQWAAYQAQDEFAAADAANEPQQLPQHSFASAAELSEWQEPDTLEQSAVGVTNGGGRYPAGAAAAVVQVEDEFDDPYASVAAAVPSVPARTALAQPQQQSRDHAVDAHDDEDQQAAENEEDAEFMRQQMFAHFKRSHSVPLAQQQHHQQQPSLPQPVVPAQAMRQHSLPSVRASSAASSPFSRWSSGGNSGQHPVIPEEPHDDFEYDESELQHEETRADEEYEQRLYAQQQMQAQQQQQQQRHQHQQHPHSAQGVQRHPMEVVYPEDDDAYPEDAEDAAAAMQEEELARLQAQQQQQELFEQQRLLQQQQQQQQLQNQHALFQQQQLQQQQLRQQQQQQQRPQPHGLQRAATLPSSREQKEQQYQQQRALLLQQQHAQRLQLQQQQLAAQQQQQELLEQQERATADAASDDDGRLPRAHSLAQKAQLRHEQSLAEQSLAERECELEQEERLYAGMGLNRSLLASAGISNGGGAPSRTGDTSFTSFAQQQQHAASLSSSSLSNGSFQRNSLSGPLRSLDAPLPGQDRLDEIARRLQLMDERRRQAAQNDLSQFAASAAAANVGTSSPSAAAAAAATTIHDPSDFSQRSDSPSLTAGQMSQASSVAAPAGEVLKPEDSRGQLYDALRKIQRLRGGRGVTALLSHSQHLSSSSINQSAANAAAAATAAAASSGSLNASRNNSILSHSLTPSFAASAAATSTPTLHLHNLLRQQAAAGRLNISAGRWRSGLVAPDEVPSFLGASQARAAAALPTRSHRAAASDSTMHDLSLSAILSHSTAAPAVDLYASGNGTSFHRSFGARRSEEELHPLVAAAVAESNATRQRLEQLQLQQVSLNQSHQALDASVRQIAAAQGATLPAPTAFSLANSSNLPTASYPSASSFLNPAAASSTAAARRAVAPDAPSSLLLQKQKQQQHAQEEKEESNGPSFFLYSESEEEQHAQRMQEAQESMARQQMQRSKLIAQQDAVLQQQQQLLLHNASQLVQSMSMMGSPTAAAAPAAAPNAVPVSSPASAAARSSPVAFTHPHAAKPYPASPEHSPSSRALQEQLESTARVWDEVDEVLTAPQRAQEDAAAAAAAAAKAPAAPPGAVGRLMNAPASSAAAPSTTTHVVRPATSSSGELNEPVVSVQTGQGHSITVNVHPVINVISPTHAMTPQQQQPQQQRPQPMQYPQDQLARESAQQHGRGHGTPAPVSARSDELERQKALFLSNVAAPSGFASPAAGPPVFFDAAIELDKYHQRNLPRGLEATVAAHLARNEFPADDVDAAAVTAVPSGAHYLDHVLAQKSALFEHLSSLEVSEAAERQAERARFEEHLARIETQARHTREEAERARKNLQRSELHASLHRAQDDLQQSEQHKHALDEAEEKETMAFVPNPSFTSPSTAVAGMSASPSIVRIGHFDARSPEKKMQQQRQQQQQQGHGYFSPQPSAPGTAVVDEVRTGASPHSSHRRIASTEGDVAPDARRSVASSLDDDALFAEEEAAARERRRRAHAHIEHLDAVEDAQRMDAARQRAEEEREFEEEMRRERAKAQLKWQQMQQDAETHARAVIAKQVREETAARHATIKAQRERLEAEAEVRRVALEAEQLADVERQRALREREEYLARLRRERDDFLQSERQAAERELRRREEALQTLRRERVQAEIALQREVELRASEAEHERERFEADQELADRQRSERQQTLQRVEDVAQQHYQYALESQRNTGRDVAASASVSARSERSSSSVADDRAHVQQPQLYDSEDDGASPREASARPSMRFDEQHNQHSVRATDSYRSSTMSAREDELAAAAGAEETPRDASSASHSHRSSSRGDALTGRSDSASGVQRPLAAPLTPEREHDEDEPSSVRLQQPRTARGDEASVPSTSRQLTQHAETDFSPSSSPRPQQPLDVSADSTSSPSNLTARGQLPVRTTGAQHEEQMLEEEEKGSSVAPLPSNTTTPQQQTKLANSMPATPVFQSPDVARAATQLPATPVFRNPAAIPPAVPVAAPSVSTLAAHRPPALQTVPAVGAGPASSASAVVKPIMSPETQSFLDEFDFDAEAKAIEDTLAFPELEYRPQPTAAASAVAPATSAPAAARAAPLLSPSKAQRQVEATRAPHASASLATSSPSASLDDSADGPAGLLSPEGDSLDESVDDFGFPKRRTAAAAAAAAAVAENEPGHDSPSMAPSTRVGSGHHRGGGGSADSYGGSSGNFDWMAAVDPGATEDEHNPPAASPADWRQARNERLSKTLANNNNTAAQTTQGRAAAIAQNTTPAPAARTAARPTAVASGSSLSRGSRTSVSGGNGLGALSYGEEDVHSDTGDADFDERFVLQSREVSSNTLATAMGGHPAPTAAAAAQSSGFEETGEFLDDGDFDRVAADLEAW